MLGGTLSGLLLGWALHEFMKSSRPQCEGTVWCENHKNQDCRVETAPGLILLPRTERARFSVPRKAWAETLSCEPFGRGAYRRPFTILVTLLISFFAECL